MVISSDTSEKAREVYFERLKEMSPAERLRLGVALGKRQIPFNVPPRDVGTRRPMMRKLRFEWP